MESSSLAANIFFSSWASFGDADENKNFTDQELYKNTKIICNQVFDK